MRKNYLIIGIFLCILCFNCFSMESTEFFQKISSRGIVVGDIIRSQFKAQSKIRPSVSASRGSPREVGDLINPRDDYIINFDQALRNAAMHMIESGHIGWYDGVNHSSARCWAPFFKTKEPLSLDSAILASSRLITEVVNSSSLIFYRQIFSGDRVDRKAVGVDFVGDFDVLLEDSLDKDFGVYFRNGLNKDVASRPNFGLMNITELVKHNEEIHKHLLEEKDACIGEEARTAEPKLTKKVLLRISFRENPKYRIIKGRNDVSFLQYNGWIINFLSIYPFCDT